ncbi:hypothetical protein QEN19_001253 [Hanseniaspora menglaensis]
MSEINNSSTSQIELKEDISSLKSEVNTLTNIVEEISKTDQSLTKKTIQLLTENIKVLVHNQQILENKLDDTLKNQFNTDQVVNELNWKVTRLLQLTSLELSNNITDSKKLTTTKVVGLTSTARKPNTVQVDGSKVTITDKEMINSLNNTITKLPIKHNIPKSKRYFHDPVANKKLLSVDSTDNGIEKLNNDFQLANKKQSSKLPSSLPQESQPYENNQKLGVHNQEKNEDAKEPAFKKFKLNDNVTNNSI